MTEDTPYTEPVSPYFQVAIPGVPYSAIRAPLGTSEESMKEWASWVATCARIISEEFAETFPSQPMDVPVHQVVVQHGSQTQSPLKTTVRGVGAYCPEHPEVEVLPSKAQYARWEEDENGNQVQANFFCPGIENGTGKNHNLWRRQLVWPE